MIEHHFDILIIGAGLSGIGTACQLAAEVPSRTVALLERRERLGGTWDLFRYPGIRSDADMLTLGYGFRPWTDPKVLADGASIREYIGETAAEYGVDERIHYGFRVTAADWSSTDRRWRVTAVHEATGTTRLYTCGYLVTCTGFYDYDAGYLPEFPDAERFAGTWVHPQHWPEDLDYSGKTVVVIGSGATAVTLVPAMARTAQHVTMLQRSPSYVLSMPSFDRISEVLSRFLPKDRVYAVARKRNVFMVRKVYQACVRWPRLSRRLLLGHVRNRVGPSVDMRHFTPRYKPWEQRMCMASDGDFFDALKSGAASIVTDEIEAVTETGVRTRSGQILPADIIVTATGLNLRMLGGAELTVDGVPRRMPNLMTYKGVLLEDVPNLAWFFGYTNAPWTLKSDIAGAYLCRLIKHMDANDYAVATPRDTEGSGTEDGLIDVLTSGYVQRGKHTMPRQGTRLPWRVLMHYEKDRRLLLHDAIDDGVLVFEKRDAPAIPAPARLQQDA